MSTLLPEFTTRDSTSHETGVCFDIQRCSLQDGPGIRTTVFLKGCPLHCAWCHNPESISPHPQLTYDASKCVGCFHCLEVCEASAHRRDAGEHFLDLGACTACGKCVDVCVGRAVRMIGEPMSIQQVLSVVLRDRGYYDKSGGGLTISGGEPMSQFEFTLGLLKAARKEGIHTCIETSGAASWRKYAEALPWIDLFLFDYKITDATLHKAMVGCTNAPLIQNLDRLIQSGAKVILRCPLIPGINDKEGHFRGVAMVSAKRPKLVGVEIMPYHNFGVGKAENLGMPASLPAIQPPTKDMQDSWIAKLHSLGCTKAKIG